MDSTMMTAFRDEFIKIALNRWEREAMKGNLDYNDLARMGPAGDIFSKRLLNSPDVARDALEEPLKTHIGYSGKRALRKVRDELWGPGRELATDLTPAQLERHRELQQRIGQRSMKRLGGIRANMPLVGPSTLPIGSYPILVGDNAGTFLRHVAGGNDPTSIMAMTLPPPLQALAKKHYSLQLPQAESVDKTLYRAVVEHEGGEKAMLAGAEAASSKKPGLIGRLLGKKHDPSVALPARPTASHLGFTPILEEKHVTWRDPEAQRVFMDIRRSNPDDAAVDALHRQFGGRPGMPIPMGGKQHAEIERRVAARDPSVVNAVRMRQTMAPYGMSHGISQEVPTLGSTVRNLVKTQARNNESRLMKAVNYAVDRAFSPARPVVSRAVDPADIGGTLMKLRSLVRK